LIFILKSLSTSVMGKPGVFKNINYQDRTITPFKVYKSWRYETTSSLDSGGPDRLVAIKPNPKLYTGNKVTLDTWQLQADSASLLFNIERDLPTSVFWYSLNHLYYKRAGKPAETFGYADPAAIERTIFDEASIISIPQTQFGEAIKPRSVIFKLKNNSLYTNLITLTDDGQGNLIDTELSSSISHEMLYLGFNSSTYERNWTDSLSQLTTSTNDIIPIYADTIIPDYSVTSKNVWIYPKSLSTSSINYGNSAYFNGTSYIRIPNHELINFRKSEDFAVSFWINPDSIPSFFGTRPRYILTKRTTATGNYLSRTLIRTGDVNVNASQYPVEITFNPATAFTTTQIVCKQSNGPTKTTLQASVLSGQNTHVLVQQSGSSFQLYINGALAASDTLPVEGNIHSKADWFLGSLGTSTSQMYEGWLDDFFIFKKALTANEVLQLAYTGSENLMVTNTNAVGNVFYEHGMIVLSDPRAKYGTSLNRPFNDKVYTYTSNVTGSGNLSQFYLEYNSTVTLYEHEYICKIKEDEFNFTSNATIRLDNSEDSEVPKSFVANEEFSPYITTVGLFDKHGRLLAVGKLGTPIKKRDDIDLNIIVRFDI
jgi:hypothetical protein